MPQQRLLIEWLNWKGWAAFMLDFEWDTEKAAANLAKHGVSFEEAATVLADPLSLTAYDPDHSQDEDRYITMGTSAESRLLLVAHTDRESSVRLISARETTNRERKNYENG